jgi:hypothetical protein
MPRIYEATGARPEYLTDLTIPVDYCHRCYGAAKRAALAAIAAGAEHEVDQDHPPYEENEYDCETCGRRLQEWDNGYPSRRLPC